MVTQKLKQFAMRFKVTNDCAENSVQLATMYNDKITKNDNQKKVSVFNCHA